MEKRKKGMGRGNSKGVIYGSEGSEITARDTGRDQRLLAPGGQNTHFSQSDHLNPFVTTQEPHHQDQAATAPSQRVLAP